MKIHLNYLIFIVFSCLVIASTVICVRLVIDDFSFNDNNPIIEVEVTDWRVYKRQGGRPLPSVTSYEVQYKFSLPNDPVEYTRAEPATGRKNLWVDFPIEIWRETKLTKKILVKYNPEDPWENKVASEFAESSNTFDNIFGLVMSTLSLSIVIVIWIGIARSYYYRKKN